MGEVEEGKQGINADGRLDLGEHTTEYTDNVLQNCTPETYNFISQSHPNKFNEFLKISSTSKNLVTCLNVGH